jgi:hypothetical protein
VTAAVAACVLVVAIAALVALRMRQQHELALIAARPTPNGPDPALAKLEERVAVLERAAALTAGKKRRA